MFNKFKNIVNSIFYTKSKLQKGSVFYGSASMFLDPRYDEGTEKWKNSSYSCKLLVDKIESGMVYYYSYYVTEDGSDYIKGNIKYVNIDSFIEKIRTLKLIIG